MKLIQRYSLYLSVIGVLSVILVVLNPYPHATRMAWYEQYAHHYDERVVSENNDWINPIYDEYYRLLYEGYAEILRSYLRVRTPELWNQHRFKKLLVRAQSCMPEYTESGPAIVLTPETRCVVWGDLHGAYHSLVRSSRQLIAMQVCDEHLTIIDPDTYFIFLGDAINRSPYSLETLQLLCELIIRNPQRVIYLAGHQESGKHWQEGTMRRALQIRVESYMQDDRIPLEESIDAFFEKLPRSATFITPEDGKHIKLSHQLQPYTGERIDTTVAVRIIGEDRELLPIPGKGFEFITYYEDSALWSLLSAPVQLYNQHLGFYNDTFLIITGAPQIARVFGDFYYSDARLATSFKKITYQLAFGIEGDRGATVEVYDRPSFKVATLVDLSGSLRPLGVALVRGLHAGLAEVNTYDTLPVSLQLIIRDDQYNPRITPRLLEQLIEQDISILIEPLGSPTLASYRSFIENGDVTVLFPHTGAPPYRLSEWKTVVHLIASNTEQVRAGLTYACDEYQFKNWAIFYQDDVYGIPPLEETRRILSERSLNKGLELSYERDQTTFYAEAAKLRERQPEVLCLFSTSVPAIKLLQHVGVDHLAGTTLITIASTMDEALRKYLQKTGLHVVSIETVPDPQRSILPIAREYRRAMQQRSFYLDSRSFEAYIATRLLAYALERVVLPIKPADIVAVFEGMRDMNFGGLPLSFDPETRTLLRTVWINDTERDEWRPVPVGTPYVTPRDTQKYLQKPKGSVTYVDSSQVEEDRSFVHAFDEDMDAPLISTQNSVEMGEA